MNNFQKFIHLKKVIFLTFFPDRNVGSGRHGRQTAHRAHRPGREQEPRAHPWGAVQQDPQGSGQDAS